MDVTIKGEMNNNSTSDLLTWDQIKGSDQSKLLVCYMGTFNMYTQFMTWLFKSVHVICFLSINERAFYDTINAMRLVKHCY